MVDSSQETTQDQTDQYPLLRERCDSNVNHEHAIHIERGGEASSSSSPDLECSRGLSPSNHADRPMSIHQAPISRFSLPSPDRTNSRSFPFVSRSEEFGHRRWTPFNSSFCISLEILFTLGQIIASIVVLCLSRHEHPRTPLFAWAVGYTAGCVVSLPVLCWRYLLRSHITEQGAAQLNQDSPEQNSVSDPSSYITITLNQSSDHEDQSRATYNGQVMRIANPRLSLLGDQLKMALDCFFAVWFVVGNVWIFGERSSVSEAPNLYRLCMAYLTLSCIGYAMPFILCVVICCCLPCIISFLGIREDQNHIRGASDESINALPTYNFKSKKQESGGTLETDADEGGEEGGIVGVGTEKERAISGEDSVCCICLARYVDEDELRELPCSHFFHAACVDRWLRINASCPLCKCAIDERNDYSPSLTNSVQQT
ncbi:hypothetical protein Nepgr_006455 [Nepenthes gracilis]|uniref:RING-type domain-containing protein n=1 Tax=Nepenthes gracilis TaxID=150966 RepID=A0AAD3S573_NEPGR|nr:hypothetical protein Nepgr_006455 [Nepenthes gracilis]